MSVDVWSEGIPDSVNKSLKPIYALENINDEQEVFYWAKQAFGVAEQRSAERIRGIQVNKNLYAGIQFLNQDTREERARSNTTSYSSSPTPQPGPKTSKVVVNHIYDLTENLVSRITRFKPNISVIPANGDDNADREAAKNVKRLIDYVQYTNDFDKIMETVARWTRIMGECYLFIEWDENKGPLHPDYVAAKKKADKAGEKTIRIKDENGKEHVVKGEIHVGDVCFRVVPADNMYLMPVNSGKFEDVEWAIERQTVQTDYLKKKYPEKAGAIKDSYPEEYHRVDYDFDNSIENRMQNETVLYTMYAKKTEFFPKGRKIIFTREVLLENKELEYEHAEFPFERITNIDLPGALYGASIYNNARQLNAIINVMYTMILKNQVLVGSPKWLVPKAANVKDSAFGNDITRMEFSGPQAPALATFQNTPGEVFGFAKDVKQQLETMFGVQGVSRGEPPPGIKAGVALQFLNEQENERFNSDVVKHNNFIRRIWIKALKVLKQYYDESDDRMLQIFGNNNEYYARKFNALVLNTAFDVQIQNSTALPQSKAARTQYLMDLKQGFPALIPDKEFVELLDLGAVEGAVDRATRAARAANSENEDFSEGRMVKEPAIYEDLLTHYDIHLSNMQGRGFRNLPEKRQEAMKDHVLATEYLMFQVAQKNPAFGEVLNAVPYYPVFFELPRPQPMMPQGGQPMSGQEMPMDPMALGPPPQGMPGELPPEMMPPMDEGQAVPMAGPMDIPPPLGNA